MSNSEELQKFYLARGLASTMSFREMMYLPAGFATLVEFTAAQSERSSSSGKGFVAIRVRRGRVVAGTGVTHGCVFGILILYAIVRGSSEN